MNEENVIIVEEGRKRKLIDAQLEFVELRKDFKRARTAIDGLGQFITDTQSRLVALESRVSALEAKPNGPQA